MENGLLTNSVLGRNINVCVTFMCRCTLLDNLPGHVDLKLLRLTTLTVLSVSPACPVPGMLCVPRFNLIPLRIASYGTSVKARNMSVTLGPGLAKALL